MKSDDEAIWKAYIKTVSPLKKKSLPKVRSVRRFFLFTPFLPPRLDLHGLTLQQAYEAFIDFFDLHVKEKTRKIVVVTGKGPNGKGSLKKEFPLWLEKKEIRDKISHTEIPPEHKGGAGAVIIYLKRNT